MMRKINRLALGAMLFALCFSAQAQQAEKTPRIGYIASAGPDAAGTNRGAFQQGLRDLGYIEGKNIIIEFRYLEGMLNSVPNVVAELVGLKVDVIVAISPLAIRIAKEKTQTIPIVMVTTADPVATGLIDSLARPGGNVTEYQAHPRIERKAVGIAQGGFTANVARRGSLERERNGCEGL